jgi:hypothetical protein
MKDRVALDWLESRKEHYEMGDGCEELVKALEVGIDAIKNKKSLINELEELKKELTPSGRFGEFISSKYVQQVLDEHISKIQRRK